MNDGTAATVLPYGVEGAAVWDSAAPEQLSAGAEEGRDRRTAGKKSVQMPSREGGGLASVRYVPMLTHHRQRMPMLAAGWATR